MAGHKEYKGRKIAKKEEISQEEAENSPILQEFLKYRDALDKRNDKHERLVKISRDVTIESKRIIFLLHSKLKNVDNKQILLEAKNRLSKLIETSFVKIAQELVNEDKYRYKRAYTPGIEEFIEALTFYNYLDSYKIYNWTDIYNEIFTVLNSVTKNNVEEVKDVLIGCSTSKSKHEDTKVSINLDKLRNMNQKRKHSDNISVNYSIENKHSEVPVTDCVIDHSAAETNKIQLPKVPASSSETFINPIENNLMVPAVPIDYILGVQDLTGELMRYGINNLAAGQHQVIFEVCDFVKDLYVGLSYNSYLYQGISKNFGRKMAVTRQSLMKIESACALVSIRGTEIPKHLLAEVVNVSDRHGDEDEGYCK